MPAWTRKHLLGLEDLTRDEVVTILDRADRVVVSVRDDGASPHSVEHSLRKAHTALTYNMSSAEYGKGATANPGSAGALHLANITTAAGGLPIRAGNTLVGAIGISGTPGAKGGGGADELRRLGIVPEELRERTRTEVVRTREACGRLVEWFLRETA